MNQRERMIVTRRAFLAGSAAAAATGCARPPAVQGAAERDGAPRPVPPSVPASVKVERVQIESNGVALVGDIYVPRGITRPVAAATFLGPFCYVREQSPSYYAARLAESGSVALAFDCRGHGESGGALRRYENPTMKAEDAKAVLDFLARRPEVDKDKLFAVGICQGASPMMKVASEHPRVRGVATVAGAFLRGGTWRVDRGKEARKKFETTGVVDYLPIIDAERTDVGLPSRYIWAWYRKWINASRWENRYAVMSDAEVWAFDMSEAARQLACPVLMVHSEEAHDPDDARKVFATIGSKDKKMFFLDGAPDHVKFYDDPATVDRAAARVAQFIKESS